jgi:hypothetical protein
VLKCYHDSGSRTDVEKGPRKWNYEIALNEFNVSIF